jgi:hypothetical protein
MRYLLTLLAGLKRWTWQAPTTQVPAPIERTERRPEAVATAFCGLPHRLSDGIPLHHHCVVLPPEALLAESQGNHARAVMVLAKAASAGPLQRHGGCWNVRRRA